MGYGATLELSSFWLIVVYALSNKILTHPFANTDHRNADGQQGEERIIEWSMRLYSEREPKNL